MTDLQTHEVVKLDYKKEEAFTRKENIGMLQILLEHLNENKRLVDILDAINRKIAEWTAVANTPCPKMSRSKKIRLAIICTILAVFAIAMLFMNMQPLMCIIPVGGIILIIGIALYQGKKRKAAWQAMIDDALRHIEIEKENAAKAQAEIDKHFNEILYPFVTMIVENDRFAPDYVYSISAVETMIHLLVNLRADAIKELINLYEDHMYKLKTEASFNNMQRSLAAAARSAARTAEAAERSAAANESAAASAQVAAASSVAMAASMSDIARSQRKAASAADRAANAADRLSR